MKVEKVKVVAHDEGWEIIEDRPDDYYVRFASDGWVMTVYYSKKNCACLKKKNGEPKYLYYLTLEQVEKIFRDPMSVYKGVSYSK